MSLYAYQPDVPLLLAVMLQGILDNARDWFTAEEIATEIYELPVDVVRRILRHPRAAHDFLREIELDPWSWMAAGLPLPDGLDADALQRARVIVYALIHALRCTLDYALPIVGRLVEIDRRIAALRPTDNA